MFSPQYTTKTTNETYVQQTPTILFTNLSVRNLISSQNVKLPLVSKYPPKVVNIQRMRTPVVLLQCYKPDSEYYIKTNDVEKLYPETEDSTKEIRKSDIPLINIPKISVPSLPIPTIDNNYQNVREISPKANQINKMKRREYSPQTNLLEDKKMKEEEKKENKKMKSESNIKSYLDNIVSVSLFKSSKQLNNDQNNRIMKNDREKEKNKEKEKDKIIERDKDKNKNKKDEKLLVKKITNVNTNVDLNRKNKKQQQIKSNQLKRKNINSQSNTNVKSTKKSKIEIKDKTNANILNNKDLSSPSLFDDYEQVSNVLNNPKTKELFSEVYELISSPSLEVDSSVLMKTNFLSNESKSISTIKEMTKNNESVENYDKELKLLTDLNLIMKSLKNNNHCSDTYIFSLYQQLTQYTQIVEIKNSYDYSNELYKEIKSVFHYLISIIEFDMTLFTSTFYQNVDELKDNVIQLLDYITNNENNKTFSNRSLILIFTVLISKLSSMYYVIPLICHELISITYDVFLDIFKSIDLHTKPLSNEDRFNISLNLYEIYCCDNNKKIDQMLYIIKLR